MFSDSTESTGVPRPCCHPRGRVARRDGACDQRPHQHGHAGGHNEHSVLADISPEPPQNTSMNRVELN